MRPPGDTSGVTVRYVYPDNPAAGAGIEPGDVLISLAGEPIQDRDGLLAQISKFQPEEEVKLDVRRGDETRKIVLKLARLPEGLPPTELPPAHGDVQPGDGDRPEVSAVRLKIPEFRNESWAYVPETFDPALPHGLVVWLHAPGGFDWDELLGRWKPLCDAHDLILLAPKAADPDRWKPTEVTFVEKVLDEIVATYTIDRSRIAVHGHEGGGTLAAMLAFRKRELVRAAALVDAAITTVPHENDPLRRLAVYTTTTAKSQRTGPIEKSIALLREARIPVTVKHLGEKPRYLNPEELAELARWIDTLDRI
jgi:serine protease Do